MPARVGGATGLVAAPPPPHPPGPQPKLNEIAGRGSGAPARGCVRGVGAGLAAVAPPGAPSARVNPHTFCASFATRIAPRLLAVPPDFSFFRRPCTAVIERYPWGSPGAKIVFRSSGAKIVFRSSQLYLHVFSRRQPCGDVRLCRPLAADRCARPLPTRPAGAPLHAQLPRAA